MPVELYTYLSIDKLDPLTLSPPAVTTVDERGLGERHREATGGNEDVDMVREAGTACHSSYVHREAASATFDLY